MGVISPERIRRREPAAPPPGQEPPEPPRRDTPWGLVAVLLVIIGLLTAINWVRDVFPDINIGNPFAEETIDRSPPAVLVSIQNLSEYHAASGHFEQIVDLNRDTDLPDELLGERTLFVAVGTVDATVDFSAVGSEAVQVSDDRRSATIVLPRPTLTGARVDPARSYVYDRTRGVFNQIGSLFSGNENDERELYLLAEQKLERAAEQGSGLIPRAEENTRRMLESMLRALGFTSVTVRFTQPG
jgi:hypothetical protein